PGPAPPDEPRDIGQQVAPRLALELPGRVQRGGVAETGDEDRRRRAAGQAGRCRHGGCVPTMTSGLTVDRGRAARAPGHRGPPVVGGERVGPGRRWGAGHRCRRPGCQRATKYFACGWWQISADVDCSGWYW